MTACLISDSLVKYCKAGDPTEEDVNRKIADEISCVLNNSIQDPNKPRITITNLKFALETTMNTLRYGQISPEERRGLICAVNSILTRIFVKLLDPTIPSGYDWKGNYDLWFTLQELKVNYQKISSITNYDLEESKKRKNQTAKFDRQRGLQRAKENR